MDVTDVNTRYDEDQTPLHVASQLGQLEIIRSLIARGADPNSENANKETPLFMASRNGKFETTQLLVENGADVNHPDSEKRTPLHEASENGHDSVAQLLLGSQANCNVKNMYQWTPLHLASRTGKSAVVRVLLRGGAEVNVQDNSKWTPLHMASQKGHVQVVELLLLARNARVDNRKADGETALHLAAYYGHVEVVVLLISHNADRYILNNKGEAALDLAREKGHENVVQLIEDQPGVSTSSSSSPSHVAPTITKTAPGWMPTPCSGLPNEPHEDAHTGGETPSELPCPSDKGKGKAHSNERSHTDPSASSGTPPLPPEHPASATGLPSIPQPESGPRGLDRSTPRIYGKEGVGREARRAAEGLTPAKGETRPGPILPSKPMQSTGHPYSAAVPLVPQKGTHTRSPPETGDDTSSRLAGDRRRGETHTSSLVQPDPPQEAVENKPHAKPSDQVGHTLSSGRSFPIV